MHGTKYVRLPVFSLLVIFRSDSRDETAQFQLPATCQTSSIIGFQSSSLGAWYVLSLRLNVMKYSWGVTEDAVLWLAAEILMHLWSYKPPHISVYVRLYVYLCLVLRNLRQREKERERAFKCQHNFIRWRGTLCNNMINTSEKLYEVRKQIFN